MGRKSREDVLLSEIAELQKSLTEERKNKKWRCPCCQKKTKLREIDLIETQFYEEPYGCTGGDRWRHGGFKFLCPKCGHENRGSNSPYMDTPTYDFMAKNRRYFRSEETEKKR